MEDNNFNRRNFDHDYKNGSRYDENTDSYYETYEEYRRNKDINSYIGRSIDDMLRGFNLGGLNDRIQRTVDMAIDEVNRSAVYKMAKDRKSTRLNSSHANISYAVFCLKKK